jgi:tetratricopeptide (TPR) repeat protein
VIRLSIGRCRLTELLGQLDLSSFVRLWLGQPELAVDHEMRALRLSPIDPRIGHMETAAAFGYYYAARFAEAALWAEKAMRSMPKWPVALGIAAGSFALSGRQDEAVKAVARLRELNPNIRIADIASIFPFRRADDTARWTEGLRRAGLSE